MERVQGIGGIFFKSANKAELSAWYRDNLGMKLEEWGGAVIPWAAQDRASEAFTVWSVFDAATTYFEPSTAPFMVNFRVTDLDAMLAQLRANGCNVDDKVEDNDFGKFGWVMDPDGNRIELWQPPAT